jgi:hypothetical protein
MASTLSEPSTEISELNSKTYPFELFLEDIFRNNSQRLFKFLRRYLGYDFHKIYFQKSQKVVNDPLPEYTTVSLDFLKICDNYHGSQIFSLQLLFKMIIHVTQTNYDQSCFTFFCEKWGISSHEFVKLFHLLSPVQANIVWKHKETLISNFLEPNPSVDSQIRMIDFIKDQTKDIDLTLEKNQDRALFFCHLLCAHVTNHARIPYDPFGILKKQIAFAPVFLITEYEETFFAAINKQKKLHPNKYAEFVHPLEKTRKLRLCDENCQLEGLSQRWCYRDQQCYDNYKCSVCHTSFQIPTPSSNTYLLHGKKDLKNGYGFPLLFTQQNDDVEPWS